MGDQNSKETNITEEQVEKELFGDNTDELNSSNYLEITANNSLENEIFGNFSQPQKHKNDLELVLNDKVQDIKIVEDTSWKDEIYKKLEEVFRNDVESFVRVQFYLDEEAIIYQNNDTPPALRTLKCSLNNGKMFKTYAMRLAEDTKTAQKDPKFKETMNLLWSRILDASEEEFDEKDHQSFDLAILADDKLHTNFALGFARAWNVIPHASREQILPFIRKVVTNRSVLNSVDEVVGYFNKGGGALVMVGLAAVTLAWDMIQNIKKWWKGEITGKRCVKNIIDSGVSTAAGVGGGVAGAALGTFGGPLGTLAGGIIGGVAVGQLAKVLVDRLTQWLFGIPKEVALENAYNYLGVSVNSSNNEVNTAYRRLCLIHHPDKGGDLAEFQFVQYNMQVIKEARGQPY